MRIAVLADVHGNEPALNAVLADIGNRNPDLVLIGGDVVNRGPSPRACYEILRDRCRREGWRMIRGNHEDYVLSERTPDAGRPEWLRKLCRHSAWTCEKIPDLLPDISTLPHQLDVIGPDGGIVRCVHASMGGNRVGLHETMGDDELHGLVGSEPDVLCVGHTHQPFIRRLNQRVVFNVGAVGMPFDGDARASYGLLEWRSKHWHAEVVRLDYDRAAQARSFSTSGFLDEAGPMASLIFEEFKRARPLLSRWHRDYEQVVAAGSRTIEETVAELIARLPPVAVPG